MLGNVDIAEIDRQILVSRINAVADGGRPGAARDLRSKTAVFLSWAVNEGLGLQASPLAGWRQPRERAALSASRDARAALGAARLSCRRSGQRSTATDPSSRPIFASSYCTRASVAPERGDALGGPRCRGRVDHPGGVTRSEVSIASTGARGGRDLLRMPRLAGSDLVFPGRGGD